MWCEGWAVRWVGFRVAERRLGCARIGLCDGSGFGLCGARIGLGAQRAGGANDGLLGDEFAEDVLKDRRMDHQHGAVAQHEQQKQALRHVEPTSGEQRNVHRVNRN